MIVVLYIRSHLKDCRRIGVITRFPTGWGGTRASGHVYQARAER